VLVKVVDKVVPDSACRCGGKFFVATVEGGGPRPRVFHTEPVCPQLGKLSGVNFLKWVLTGEEPAAPTPNRAQRRRAERLKRRNVN
jgi:hypothetical protein